MLPFSELYSKTDVDIATSQFNYHLQKLVGPFIEKTENGYRLRHEAVELYRTILAGSFTRTTSIEPFQVGADCYHCGAPTEAQYSDRRFTIPCPECGRDYPVGGSTLQPPAESSPESAEHHEDDCTVHEVLEQRGQTVDRDAHIDIGDGAA
jgi:hypothetical protein